MPKLQAKSVKIFSNDVDTTLPFGDFDTANYTKDPDLLQQSALYDEGWSQNSTQPNKTPITQHFNTLSYLHSRELAYLKQAGIPEYVADTTYYMESVVRKEGTYELYGSLIDDNTGNALPDRTDDANWKYIIDLEGTGGLKKLDINDSIFYGGGQQLYRAAGLPVYNKEDKSYFLEYPEFFFVSDGITVGGVDEFVMVHKFNTSDITSQTAIYGSDTDGILGIQLDIDGDGTDRLQLWASSNGSTGDIATGVLGTTTISINTDYYVRTTKTLTNYIIELSTDGTNWNQEMNIPNSSQVFAGFKPIFGARTPTTNGFRGKLWLSETSISINGVEVVPNETEEQAFILNSIVWKGETRSIDNSTDIVSNDFIRSNEIRNQYYEFIDDGRLPPYNPETLSVSMNGTEKLLFIDTPDVSTDDLDFRNRVNLTSVSNEPVLSIGGAFPTASLVCKIISGVMNIFCSSNGSSWNIANGNTGTKVYSTGITYDFRFAKTPTGYVLQYSENLGQTWIDDITITTALYIATNQRTLWGGDYSPNPDIWLEGTMYLEGISLFTNGEYAMAPQDPKTATIPDRLYYGYVGLNSSEDVIFERCYNEDGSDLEDIVGAKRRVYKSRYDAEGDIIQFNWYYEKGGRAKLLYIPWLFQPRDLTSTLTRKFFTAPPSTEAISQVASNSSGGTTAIQVSYDGNVVDYDVATGVTAGFILHNVTFQLDNQSSIFLSTTNNNPNGTEVRELGFYDERND